MPSRTMPLRCRPSVASMSLGRAAFHKLPHKLDMASKYGFEGFELFYEDLETYTQETFHDTTPASLLKAAEDIRDMCSSKQLEIVCLQPFMHYEGLRDRNAHAQRVEDLRLWCKLARKLNTDLIGLPSSFLASKEVTDDLDVVIEDMREAADVAAEQNPPIKLAYEALAWGTYVDTWEQSWDIVERVDRPNFGICLDTFNMAGRIYADPASASGKTPNAELEVAASCKRLATRLAVSKVFFIQVVDGERLEEPLVEGHEYYNADQATRMSWSRNCRLFYGEQDRGGYLPVRQILQAYLHELGFKGWLSQELFNRSMANPEHSTPEDHASRAAVAWTKMVKDLSIE